MNCCLEKDSKPLYIIVKTKGIEDIELINSNSINYSGPAWLLANELMPRSLFYYYNI